MYLLSFSSCFNCMVLVFCILEPNNLANIELPLKLKIFGKKITVTMATIFLLTLGLCVGNYYGLQLNPNLVNKLTAETYAELFKSNRNFDIIINYHANTKFCDICQHFNHEFHELKRAYSKVNNLYFAKINIINNNIHEYIKIGQLPSIIYHPKGSNIKDGIVYEYESNEFEQELKAEHLSNWIRKTATIDLSKFDTDYEFIDSHDLHQEIDEELLESKYRRRSSKKKMKQRNIKIGIVASCIIILIVVFVGCYLCAPSKVKSE